MMQRICPVCDQVMKSAHYCRTCRSWVRQPWTREVTYYLNERHPQNESGCSYHDSSDRAKSFEAKPFITRQTPVYTAASAKGKTNAAGTGVRVKLPGNTAPGGNRSGAKANGSGARGNWSGAGANGSGSGARPEAPKSDRAARAKIFLIVMIIIVAIHVLSEVVSAAGKIAYFYFDNSLGNSVEYEAAVSSWPGEGAGLEAAGTTVAGA